MYEVVELRSGTETDCAAVDYRKLILAYGTAAHTRYAVICQ